MANCVNSGDNVKKPRKSARYGESGYARLKDDAYQTPPWATAGVLQRVALRGRVWEPACGDGAMVEGLRAAGYRVLPTDISNKTKAHFLYDFLSAEPTLPDGVQTIFTNPPYERATEFVRRALELVEPVGGMVVMLLRREWDCPPSRLDLYKMLTRKLTLTRRIRWIPGSTGSPREHHAFFVWDYADLGARRMDWI